MIIIWYNFFKTKHLFTASHYDLVNNLELKKVQFFNIFSNFKQLFSASGVYVFTLILAFLSHIVFEAPIDNLVKLMIRSQFET